MVRQSGSDALRHGNLPAPAELSAVAPHPVQHDSQLAGHGYLGAPHATRLATPCPMH